MSKVNIWESRLRTMLNVFSPTKSQRGFILSVWDCIERSPEAFPTRAQASILANIWKHLQRKKAEEEAMKLVEAEEKI